MTERDAVPPPDVLDPDSPVPPPAWAAWVSAVPDFGLSALFLITWIAPESTAAGVPRDLILLVLMEFIIIHSSAFMGLAAYPDAGSRSQRVKSVLGLGVFYSLFVIAFSVMFHSVWPLVSFWGLMLNRLLGVLLGQAQKGREADLLRISWAANMACYLFAVLITTLVTIPRLGFNSSALRERMHLPGTGLWIDEPWRVMAVGVLYYGLVGLSELSGHAWMRPWKTPKKRERALAPRSRAR